MNYEEKMNEARSLVDRHNNGVSTDAPQVDCEAFLAKLIAEGGTTDEGLKACSWEDLQGFGLPKLLARNVAVVFRGKAVQADRKSVITPIRAQNMSVRELLEAYDPRNADNVVGKRLNELAKGKRCIVFSADGAVNVDASETLLDELRDNFPERESMSVNNHPQKTYPIGERPNQLADENPLYPGRPLRPDGTCDQTNRSWSGVPDVIRILVYLAVTVTKEIAVNQLNDAHTVIDLAVSDGAELKIRTRYMRASVLYDDHLSQGNLPSLKVARPSSSAALASGANNPFGNKKF